MAFYTYIVRCRDGSLYTGWTTDIEDRVKKHSEGRGAKYTRSRRPVTLVYCERLRSALDAQRREREIKKLTHGQKLALIGAGPSADMTERGAGEDSLP